MSRVTRWRLNVARHLLRNTDQGVEEIARQVGYHNLLAFTRVFKRYIGLAPAAWRADQTS
jgi:AraC-like DNA-binding protein